jgi:hypothetical protein
VKPCLKFLALLQLLLLTEVANAAAPHIDINRTRQKAKQSLAYCKQKGYNTRYCILIDVSLHSGVKRFMVWDFRKNDTHDYRPGKPWLWQCAMGGRVDKGQTGFQQ